MKRVLLVFGTRPEAIKLAPVVEAIERRQLEPVIAVTAQHRDLLDQVLTAFDIRPQFDLDLMRPAQSLSEIAARILLDLPPVLDTVRPDVVMIHGDTTTTLAAALVAHHQHVPIAHVEAGYRTPDVRLPFPEEANRRLVSVLADVHYAVNQRCASALLAEGHRTEDVVLVGNPGIDALAQVLQRSPVAHPPAATVPGARLRILVTMHRRESWGQPMRAACMAIRQIAACEPDVEVMFSAHPNPSVSEVVHSELAGIDGVHVLPPLDYVDFSHMLASSDLVLSDSGGVHEEAVFLQKPLVLLRDTTEWPEVVQAGAVRLAGTSTSSIVRATLRIVAILRSGGRTPAHEDPLADGRAAERIADDLTQRLRLRGNG